MLLESYQSNMCFFHFFIKVPLFDVYWSVSINTLVTKRGPGHPTSIFGIFYYYRL